MAAEERAERENPDQTERNKCASVTEIEIRHDEPAINRDYLPPTVTLLPAPLTLTSALVGVAYLTVPSAGFFTAPSAMETLAAVAPFSRATGMPPISAQEPPQSAFETESRFPPAPREATRAPPMLA